MPGTCIFVRGLLTGGRLVCMHHSCLASFSPSRDHASRITAAKRKSARGPYACSTSAPLPRHGLLFMSPGQRLPGSRPLYRKALVGCQSRCICHDRQILVAGLNQFYAKRSGRYTPPLRHLGYSRRPNRYSRHGCTRSSSKGLSLKQLDSYRLCYLYWTTCPGTTRDKQSLYILGSQSMPSPLYPLERFVRKLRQACNSRLSIETPKARHPPSSIYVWTCVYSLAVAITVTALIVKCEYLGSYGTCVRSAVVTGQLQLYLFYGPF